QPAHVRSAPAPISSTSLASGAAIMQGSPRMRAGTSQPSSRRERHRMSGTLRLHPDDDVVIAKLRLSAGTIVDTDDGPVALAADIPAGHKIAIRARATGDPVRRYGQVIGFATVPIAPGAHVHQHNLEAGALHQRFEVAVNGSRTPQRSAAEVRTFDGY